MTYYSPKYIEQIRKIDLYTYLKNYNPEELVEISRNNFSTKTHDSVSISNGMWYRFSTGIGGVSALDYLIKVEGMSFSDAIDQISRNINGKEPLVYNTSLKKEKKQSQLNLPKKAENNIVIINYLISRGIDKEIILECIDKELIYQEDGTDNVIFVGYDKNNIPRYAGLRATDNSNLKKDIYGSNKAFSFKLESMKKNDVLHIFESAIDLLSYATLVKLSNQTEWYNLNLLSLAGVYQPSKNIEDSKMPLTVRFYLNNHPYTKTVILHLDNDRAGRESTKAFKTLLKDKYNVIDSPPVKGKDVNDFLCLILKERNIGKEVIKNDRTK